MFPVWLKSFSKFAHSENSIEKSDAGTLDLQSLRFADENVGLLSVGFADGKVGLLSVREADE